MLNKKETETDEEKEKEEATWNDKRRRRQTQKELLCIVYKSVELSMYSMYVQICQCLTFPARYEYSFTVT